ncbi:protein of unknown function (plasmid) [Azospirillum baldaniorum]|uniref:Uncharacterized protein n=1 Tax=Azospirillum baldaniorum TaxID=1064539 RepID=A0A9P1JV18_9PROT|nr:protein of unknown function [Azospirillum baldaniorum]
MNVTEWHILHLPLGERGKELRNSSLKWTMQSCSLGGDRL